MPQCAPDTEAKVTGVCIHTTKCNPSIATMTMNQRQFIFTHLPTLLHNFGKSSVEHDFSRMVAVKVNFHLLPQDQIGLSGDSARKRCGARVCQRIYPRCGSATRNKPLPISTPAD